MVKEVKERMWKVVINTCFGGFELSEEAVKWLLENAEDQSIRDYIIRDLADNSENYECVSMDLGYELSRHDKDLVRCVEALGEKASGMCSKLKIVEIDCPMYEITDYDGKETLIVASDFGSFTIIND